MKPHRMASPSWWVGDAHANVPLPRDGAVSGWETDINLELSESTVAPTITPKKTAIDATQSCTVIFARTDVAALRRLRDH